MTSITFIADDLDKTVTQLMHDHDADTASISEFEGAPVVVFTSPAGESWFLLADEKPEHAPGEWFECEGMMVTQVEPAGLCTCEPGYTSQGVYYQPEAHGCVLHGSY